MREKSIGCFCLRFSRAHTRIHICACIARFHLSVCAGLHSVLHAGAQATDLCTCVVKWRHTRLLDSSLSLSRWASVVAVPAYSFQREQKEDIGVAKTGRPPLPTQKKGPSPANTERKRGDTCSLVPASLLLYLVVSLPLSSPLLRQLLREGTYAVGVAVVSALLCACAPPSSHSSLLSPHLCRLCPFPFPILFPTGKRTHHSSSRWFHPPPPPPSCYPSSLFSPSACVCVCAPSTTPESGVSCVGAHLFLCSRHPLPRKYPLTVPSAPARFRKAPPVAVLLPMELHLCLYVSECSQP